MAKTSPPPTGGSRGLASFHALSVWEIAHRWHNTDPNGTDPEALPLPVQDTLRSLCLALHTQEIPASDKWGNNFGIVADGPKYAEWLAQADATGQARGYRAAVEDHTREHREAVAGLEHCAGERRFDKARLESVFISAWGIQRFCELEHVALPEFWFPDGDTEHTAPPRREQIDKAACQAVALTLWDHDPNLTIADMIQHDAIRNHGNGARYTEKTLRNWLSEVDPRSQKQKTGRPKKIPPKDPPST